MRRGLLIVGIALCGFFGAATFTHAATLYLAPSFATVPTGGEFSVDVKIDTEGTAINAAEGEIQFDPQIVQFVNANLSGSAFGLWLNEPALSAAGNSITFIGGTPKGTAGGALHIARLTFRARASGTAQFVFLTGSITASDGLGTNVTSGTSGANFAIGVASVTQTPTPVTSVAPGRTPTPTPEVPVPVQRPARPASSLPQQPIVRVPFYPDPSKWYSRIGEVIVLWDVPDDVTRIAAEIDENPNTEPRETQSTLTTGQRFGTLQEGVWYAHVQFRNNIGWGPVAHYRIALDTTAPLAFEADIDNASSDNPTPAISFSSGDSLSGVERVVVIVDDGASIMASGSPVILSPQAPGTHIAVVRVVDRAGNSSEDDVAFEILPLPTPTIDFIASSVVSGETVFISGRTLPLSFVDVRVSALTDGLATFSLESQSDENGNWNVRFGEGLARGTYEVQAMARDVRRAISYPTEVVEFSIRSAPVLSIGPVDLGWVELIIIIISLAVGDVGIWAWILAKRRTRRAAYNIIGIRDMEKMNTLITQNLSEMEELVHNEKEGLKKKMLVEFDMHMQKAMKASNDLSRYVTGTVKKSGK